MCLDGKRLIIEKAMQRSPPLGGVHLHKEGEPRDVSDMGRTGARLSAL